MHIFYYLEDDTVSVTEPRVANSGLVQGPFVKRCKLPLRLDGIRVGAVVQLGGRAMRVCGIDDFTRSFYEARGEAQLPNFVPPDSELATDITDDRPASRLADSVVRGMQFLAHDGKGASVPKTDRTERRAHLPASHK